MKSNYIQCWWRHWRYREFPSPPPHENLSFPYPIQTWRSDMKKKGQIRVKMDDFLIILPPPSPNLPIILMLFTFTAWRRVSRLVIYCITVFFGTVRCCNKRVSASRYCYVIQTVTKTIQSENHIFENFLRINSKLFFHSSWDKGSSFENTFAWCS